jgi:hypothetical protein
MVKETKDLLVRKAPKVEKKSSWWGKHRKVENKISW